MSRVSAWIAGKPANLNVCNVQSVEYKRKNQSGQYELFNSHCHTNPKYLTAEVPIPFLSLIFSVKIYDIQKNCKFGEILNICPEAFFKLW